MRSTQPPELNYALDFSGRLPVTAQMGMATAEDNANHFWKVYGSGCVLAVAKRMREFTSDDVIAEMATVPNAPSTHNLCAIGPMMRRAKKDGMIRSTGRFVRSKVAHKNGNWHEIWESQMYTGGQQ